MAATAPPEQALISVERGRAELLEGNHSRAEELAREALAQTEATEPGIAGAAYDLLARTALAQGDIDEARTRAGEAIGQLRGRCAPRYVRNAYLLLSEIEEAAGNLPEALEASRSAAEVGSGNPGHRHDAAWQ
jgi:tetratricopeptide (TPR) repeat protein